MKKNISRVVVITGSTSGIGKTTAELFSKAGDIVCHLSLDNPDGVDNFYECDVTKQDMVSAAMDAIGAKYGKIDILINNAGYGLSGVTELVPLERAHAIFDVNFFGVLACSQAALKYMSAGSKIINIASACALFPLPFRSLYCASKSAVNMLSLSMRLECKDSGIEICSVCPGDVRTNFTANREKHFDTTDRYGDRPRVAASRIDSKNDKRMDPSVIAKRLLRLSYKKHLPAQTIIGAKYKLLYFANKLLPIGCLLHFDEKFMGGFTKGSKYDRNN